MHTKQQGEAELEIRSHSDGIDPKSELSLCIKWKLNCKASQGKSAVNADWRQNTP